MQKSIVPVIVIVAVLVAVSVFPAAAQTSKAALVGPKAGVGPRASAMGGAFVAVADDATALYWNPAGLALVDRWTFTGNVIGRAQNLDSVDDASDVYDIVTESSITGLDFDFVRRQVGVLADRPFVGEVAAVGALAMPGWAVGGYGIAGVAAGLSTGVDANGNGNISAPLPNGATFEDGEFVQVQGDGLWQHSEGIAMGRRLGERLTVGVGVRKMTMGYGDKNWKASVNVPVAGGPPDFPAPVETGNISKVTDSSTTADVGFLYTLTPQARAGLVARSLTSPDFTLGAGRVEADMVVDAGLAFFSEDGRATFAVDAHNLTEANDVACTVHLGYEYRPVGFLTLRAGSAESTLTYGVGLNLGILTIDLASRSGGKAIDQAGFAFSIGL